MLASILTAKGQAIFPLEVRKVLQLKPGDKLMFEVKNQQVVISNSKALDYSYHQALSSTLIEWASSYDDEAYDDL